MSVEIRTKYFDTLTAAELKDSVSSLCFPKKKIEIKISWKMCSPMKVINREQARTAVSTNIFTSGTIDNTAENRLSKKQNQNKKTKTQKMNRKKERKKETNKQRKEEVFE